MWPGLFQRRFEMLLVSMVLVTLVQDVPTRSGFRPRLLLVMDSHRFRRYRRLPLALAAIGSIGTGASCWLWTAAGSTSGHSLSKGCASGVWTPQAHGSWTAHSAGARDWAMHPAGPLTSHASPLRYPEFVASFRRAFHGSEIGAKFRMSGSELSQL